MTARYIYALGREGVLPKVFGSTTRTGAPVAGSGAQSLVGLSVIIAFTVTGADPVVGLFYTASTSGALGILILLVAAAVAVLGFFASDTRGEGLWRTRIAPCLALTGLMTILVLVLAHFGTLIGVTDSSPLRWGIPAAYLATVLGGCAYAARLRARRPDIYRAIGLGAKAALERPASAWSADATSAALAELGRTDPWSQGSR
jgi:amino acid transporter